MKKLEQYATTRVRVDGKQEDRVTGNLVWYAVEHPETRPVEDESLPEGHKWRVMPRPGPAYPCRHPQPDLGR